MATENAKAMEAIIMVAEQPVPPQLLAQLLELKVDEVEAILQELVVSYEVEDRGFILTKVAGGYRYQSHPDMAVYVERYVLEGQTARLSAAALETLAIIAYKQPISRAQVAQVRGVNVDGVVRTLEQRGYIAEVGKDPGPGNPTLFGTTDLFLERLGINSVEDLPPIAAFVPGPDIVEQLEQGLRAEIDSDLAAELAADAEAAGAEAAAGEEAAGDAEPAGEATVEDEAGEDDGGDVRADESGDEPAADAVSPAESVGGAGVEHRDAAAVADDTEVSADASAAADDAPIDDAEAAHALDAEPLDGEALDPDAIDPEAIDPDADDDGVGDAAESDIVPGEADVVEAVDEGVDPHETEVAPGEADEADGAVVAGAVDEPGAPGAGGLSDEPVVSPADGLVEDQPPGAPGDDVLVEDLPPAEDPAGDVLVEDLPAVSDDDADADGGRVTADDGSAPDPSGRAAAPAPVATGIAEAPPVAVPEDDPATPGGGGVASADDPKGAPADEVVQADVPSRPADTDGDAATDTDAV